MYIILKNCSCILKSRLRFMVHDYLCVINFLILIIIIIIIILLYRQCNTVPWIQYDKILSTCMKLTAMPRHNLCNYMMFAFCVLGSNVCIAKNTCRAR